MKNYYHNLKNEILDLTEDYNSEGMDSLDIVAVLECVKQRVLLHAKQKKMDEITAQTPMRPTE